MYTVKNTHFTYVFLCTSRFAINIGCGDGSGQLDIAVHFNVRMPQCYVVRNTRRNGKWGNEETTAYRYALLTSAEPN